MVFILLGPPNYAGRSEIDAGEDGVSRATDLLPKELPFRELRFEFQTRGGYGIGVLQKDAVNLSVLSKMADLIARPR
jgi:hypothetical protein